MNCVNKKLQYLQVEHRQLFTVMDLILQVPSFCFLKLSVSAFLQKFKEAFFLWCKESARTVRTFFNLSDEEDLELISSVFLTFIIPLCIKDSNF
jgi:hypothetical protein